MMMLEIQSTVEVYLTTAHPPIHGVVAMAVRVVENQPPGGRYRVEEVALRLTDNSVWHLPRIFVSIGDKSISLRSAAWSLKEERIGRRHSKAWQMVRSPLAAASPA